MRISSVQMMGGYLKRLNDSYEEQTKLMEQADGNSLHRPSDDSVRYSKYLRFENTNTENIQYTANVRRGVSWMSTADATLVNMTNLEQTIVEKTVLAANDTNNETNLVEISKEVLGYIQQIVALGNDKQGDRFLFSGQSDLTQPFVLSLDESEWVTRGLSKTLDDTQKIYFNDADSAGNVTQMLTLKGSDGNTYYLNTLTRAIYTKEFVDEGYKAKMALGRESVAEGDEVYKLRDEDGFNVAGFFKATGELRTSGNYTVTKDGEATDYTDKDFGSVIAAYEAGSTITIKCDCAVTIEDTAGNSKLLAAGTLYTLQEGESALVGGQLRGENTTLMLETTTTVDGASSGATKVLLGSKIDADAGQTCSASIPVTVVTSGYDANGDYYANYEVIAAGEEFTLAADQKAYYGVSPDIVESKDKEYEKYVWGSTDAEGHPATITFEFDTIKQPLVTYHGDNKKISMVKRNGHIDPTADTVNISGQDIFGTDIFDNVNSGNQYNTRSSGAAALNDLLTVYAKMRGGDTHWLSSDGISLSDSSHLVTVDAETTIAARQQVYEEVDTMLQTQSTIITNDINDVSAADVAKLAVQLMAQQTIYNMSLSVGSRILPPTLADYL